MGADERRTLSVREAAKLIYATRRPTDEQIGRVVRRLQKGVLKGDCSARHPMQWTTTSGAVAEYMASEAYHRQMREDKAGKREAMRIGQAAPRKRSFRGRAELGSTYQQLLKDYFLAMTFRRRARRFSKAFDRAVLLGQAAFVLMVMALTAAVVKPMIFYEPPPEQTAVRKWLTENTERFEVRRWHPPQISADGAEVRVRVEYRYSPKRGRPVETDRLFTISNNRVVSFESR